MKVRLPFTRDELNVLIPKLDQHLQDMEDAEPFDVQPIGCLTLEECHEYFGRLLDAAAVGPLSRQQCFLHGQLLCVFKNACRAEMLKKPGRYFVVSEEDLLKLQREHT